MQKIVNRPLSVYNLWLEKGNCVIGRFTKLERVVRKKIYKANNFLLIYI
jgi:hypothetical protein